MLQTNLPRSQLDRPASYRIVILGRLDDSWREWLDEMDIVTIKDERGETITTLTGCLLDQSALHGLLAHIRDLCLPLLLVQNLEISDCEVPGSFSAEKSPDDFLDVKE
jgi:hypothetical protein